MHRLFLPALALTLLVASHTSTQAQTVAQKRVLWKDVASISVPRSVNLGFSQNSYYFSLISSGEPLMAAGNIYWNDRLGRTSMQQQVAAIKAEKRDYRAKLLSERYLSMGRVWTADFESTEGSGNFKSVYRSRVRLSKAPKGFIESSITGNEQAWAAAAFKNTLLPMFNSLEVVGLSTPTNGGGSSSGGGAAQPSSGKLQNVSVRVVGSSVEVKGYDAVAKTWRTRSILVGGSRMATPVVEPNSGVVAWVGAFSVGYAVYDPVRKLWVDESMLGSGASGLRVSPSGVVAWIWPSSVGYAFYDASRRTWAGDSMLGSRAGGLQISAAGTVAWIWPSSVGMAAYDPALKAWTKESVLGSGAKDLRLNAGKTVAWIWPSAVGFAVHDPSRKRWVSSSSLGSGAKNIQVNALGGVSWVGTANRNFTAVYNSKSGSWSNGSSGIGSGSSNTGSGGGVAQPGTAKLQDVSAKIVGSWVEYKGYDPVAKKWISDSSSAALQVKFLKVDRASGVVAWATDAEAGYAVYDPAIKRWQKDWMLMRSVKQLEVGASGVVAFFSESEVGYAIYDADPKTRRWQEEWMLMRSVKQLALGSSGVLAFVSSSEAGYATYDPDPKIKRWVEGSRLLGSTANPTVSVAANGRVSWTYRWGSSFSSEGVTYRGGGRWPLPTRQ
jgi:hypothetical protein